MICKSLRFDNDGFVVCECFEKNFKFSWKHHIVNMFWDSHEFAPYFWSLLARRNADHSCVLSTSFFHSLLKLFKVSRWLNVDNNMWPYYCMLIDVMWYATFDGICSTSFLFNKYQHWSSSTSIKVMMCIVFGNNKFVTMSFGKGSVYEPTINFFWNIHMNNE